MIRFPLPHPDYRWQPVSKIAVAGWTLFYLWAMYTYWNGPIFLQNVHLVSHEAGHLLFSYTGNQTITVLMGTGMELAVPLALAISFAWRGHTLGTAFCLWMFFNAFIGIGIYMADARDKALPLVSPGMASDEIEGHDWEYIFNWLGVIKHDIAIGRFTKAIGWVGMALVVGWLIYMWRRSEEGSLEEDRFFTATGE
jgi:hypothetical protein